MLGDGDFVYELYGDSGSGYEGTNFCITPDDIELAPAPASLIELINLRQSGQSIRTSEQQARVDNNIPTQLPTSTEQPVLETDVNVPQWPQLNEQAMYGLAGDFVRLIEPHSEADPVAILSQTITAFSSIIGRRAYFEVESTKHHTNLFAVLVGESSKARKGTSWNHVLTRFKSVDDSWEERVKSGLSSGEGLIWEVRDPIYKREKITEKGVTRYDDVMVDAGVEDKRLLVQEGEFASVLKNMNREGNILSAIIRNLWDSGNANTLVKNSPAKTTGAHVSIVGHSTRDELLRYLQATEQANGFANRFLFFSVRRSKLLPLGGQLHKEDFAPIIRRLREAVDRARRVGQVEFDNQAKALWFAEYPQLSEGHAGMLGAITSRAEAQVLRLATMYALFDWCEIIKRPHLEAALALWKYAEDSARFIFGSALGDPTADEIMRALRVAPEVGMTRTQIRDLFNRHNTNDVQRALNSLAQRGMVRMVKEESGGRPIERYFAVLK